MNPKNVSSLSEAVLFCYRSASFNHFLLAALVVSAIALPRQHRRVARRIYLAVAYSFVSSILILGFNYVQHGVYFSRWDLTRPADLIAYGLIYVLGHWLFLSAAFADRPRSRPLPPMRFGLSSIALFILYLAIAFAYWNATDGFSLRSIKWNTRSGSMILQESLRLLPPLIALLMACWRYRDHRTAYAMMATGCTLLIVAQVGRVYYFESMIAPVNRSLSARHLEIYRCFQILGTFANLLTWLAIFPGRWSALQGNGERTSEGQSPRELQDEVTQHSPATAMEAPHGFRWLNQHGS